jgi:hypothetical protein
VHYLTLAALQFIEGGNGCRVRNENFKGQPASEGNLPVEQADGVGRTYPKGGKYTFCLLFYVWFNASVD